MLHFKCKPAIFLMREKTQARIKQLYCITPMYTRAKLKICNSIMRYTYILTHLFYSCCRMSPSQSLHYFLFLLLLPSLPLSSAYRAGARSDSCYGHEIMHGDAQAPSDPVKVDCTGACRYDLVLDGLVDNNDTENPTVTGSITRFECGRIYQCKLSMAEVSMELLLVPCSVH